MVRTTWRDGEIGHFRTTSGTPVTQQTVSDVGTFTYATGSNASQSGAEA